MDRRRFLSAVTGTLTAALGGLVALPLLGHLLSPLRRRPGDASEGDGFVSLGPVEDFEFGRPRRVSFPVEVQDGWERKTTHQAVWVTRRPDDTFLVLSTVCPHLGCSVTWAARREAFACPCHESEFAPDGERRTGPARRGLDPLPARVLAGRVEVRWMEFAAGTSERQPVSGLAT